MTFEQINSPEWSKSILSLSDPEKVLALTTKALTGEGSAVLVLRAILENHELFSYLLSNETVADTVWQQVAPHRANW